MNRFKITVTAVFGLIMGMLLLVSFPMAISAQVDPVLPPRPTPEPATTTASAVGATITLNAPVSDHPTLAADNWAIVQWQDNHGDWNNVEGWQGNLAYDGSSKSWEVIWWVARANFGEEDFRWVVYEDESMKKRIATSVTFDLPENNLQGVEVNLKN